MKSIVGGANNNYYASMLKAARITPKRLRYSPSPNFKLTTLRLWGNDDETYEVIIFKIHSVQETFSEHENFYIKPSARDTIDELSIEIRGVSS